MRPLSPIELEFLLWCYYNPTPSPKEHPSLEDFKIRMMMDDILKRIGEDNFTVTAKGAVWICMILDTLYPVQKWMPGQQ